LTGSIDLNADIGEHDGDGYAADASLLDVVSSANIACGTSGE
jgi:lactam utilization protein B